MFLAKAQSAQRENKIKLCVLCAFARNFSFVFNKKLLYRQTLITLTKIKIYYEKN